MGEGDGLGEILVEAEGAGDGPGDLGHLQGVGEAGAVVVPGPAREDLGLVLQAAEGGGVEDPVPVLLVRGAVEDSGSGWARPRVSRAFWA